MQKIKLELETLHVSSFEAGKAEHTLRGTVHANRFEQWRDDIPHDPTGLACTTGGFNYCAAETYGCIGYTGSCTTYDGAGC
jgi:hypothetical protein